MTTIADKKFEILNYTQSNEFSIDGLADKLNELTNLYTGSNQSENIIISIAVFEEIVSYIEISEENFKFDRFDRRTMQEIINDKDMPEVYYKLIEIKKAKETI